MSQALLGDTYMDELIYLYVKGMGKATDTEIQEFINQVDDACMVFGMVQTALQGLVTIGRVDDGGGDKWGVKPVLLVDDVARNREELVDLRRKLARL